MEANTRKRLENLLVERKLATPKALQELSDTPGAFLASSLVRRYDADRAGVLAALGECFQLPVFEPDKEPTDPAARGDVPPEQLLRSLAAPMRVEDGHVVVALADPEDLGAIDDLQALLGKPLHEGVALASDIRLFLQAHCRLDNADDIVADMLGQEPGGEGEPAMRMTTRSEAIKPVPQLLDRLLQDAVRRQALHFFLIPFGEEEVRVRMCLPGKILETDSYATRLHGNLINRLRVLCDLVGKDKRQPQNGAFLKVIDGEKHRFDVMIVPAETGDAVTVFIDQQPDEEVQEQPRCPGCDAHVKKGWTFCPACGAQL